MPGIVQIVIQGDNQQAIKTLENVVSALEKLGGAGKFVEELKGKLLAALSVGALVEFTRRAIEGADAIGKLAQKTGIAIGQLSGLGSVAAADGVSLQTLQIGIKYLSEWMVKNGQASADVNEVLLQQADIFAALPDGAEKTALAVQRFGRAGEQMIPFLNKGSEAIREQVKEANDLGATVGPAFAASAAQFNDNMHRVGLVFQGFFNQIARELLPGLNKMLEWFVEFAKRADGFKPVIETLVFIFKTFAIAATAVAGAFASLGAFIGQFSGVLAETGDPFIAWEEGARAATAEMEMMEKVMDSIGGKVTEAGQGPKRSSAPLTGTYLDTQRALLQEAQLRAANITNDQTISQVERNRELRDIYGEQLKRLDLIQKETAKQIQADLVATKEGTLMTQQRLDHENDILAVQKLRAEIAQKLHGIEADESFVTRMRDNLQNLSDSWGNLARNAADALTNSIQAGVQGVTDSIMGAIEGTKTWGQVFLQVGRSIIASLIQVVVQWIAQMTIVRALQKIFHIEQTAQAGQRAAAEAPGAALASTASYGTAAIIGAVALAAVLALALSAAVGAFAEGGVIRGGEQLIRVNERGQEAVLNAQALANVGEGFVAGLNAGLSINQASAASPAAPSIKNSNNVHVVVYDDKARLNEYLQSADGSAVVVDLMRKNLHQITGRT